MPLSISVKKAISVIGSLSLTPFAWAGEISGTIHNAEGTPVAGAFVQVEGTKTRVATDKNGHFSLSNVSSRQHKLHVKSAGFAPQIFTVEENRLAPLNIVLTSTALEVVEVVGLPWHTTNIESAQPITVLGEDELRRRQSSTLGDTLKNEAGIHSSYYGPVASSPIIRGLDGPRVLITQNGLDAGDASRVGPDHVVATEASTARQIEVFRGPSTLFYGSGAIGGVVNVVDDRVPESSETRAEWRAEYGSVADEQLVSGSATTGTEHFAWHIDGFWRDSEDYEIPGSAVAGQDESAGNLANSAYDAKGLNVGGSYLFESGFAGVSFGRLERTYGIPGHSHGEEDVPVHADVEQDRVQFISEFSLDFGFLRSASARLGSTDYSHDEVELSVPVTNFANESHEARFDLFHHPVEDWLGALTLHYKRSDFSAEGAEGFTPPSLTESWALALVEERHFGDVLVQLGGRMERIEISTDSFVFDGANSDLGLLSLYEIENQSTPYSLSAGAVWEFTPGYNFAVNLTHASRAPSASELLSYGAHIGSGLFEVGSLINAYQRSDGSTAFELNRSDTELETSNNIDISIRKFSGAFGFTANVFYNRIGNYYYQANTGLTQTIAHQHDDHFHYFEMPVYAFQARDADLYGMESEFVWKVDDSLRIGLLSDYVRGELREGGNLPRIPPPRFGGRINYNTGAAEIEFNASHYFKQNDVAEMEDDTSGYDLIDLMVSYKLDSWAPGFFVYLKGQNLTDEYARVHSSFLKDKAPLPGRGFVVGIGGTY